VRNAMKNEPSILMPVVLPFQIILARCARQDLMLMGMCLWTFTAKSRRVKILATDLPLQKKRGVRLVLQLSKTFLTNAVLNVVPSALMATTSIGKSM